MALLKIGDTEMPTPLAMQVGIQDLDSETGTGRNQEGTMFRDRVTVKRTVHCEWGPLSKAEMSLLLTAISPVAFTVTYPDPQDGALRTIKGYVGDRTVPLLIPLGDNDWMWGSMSADFVEM